MQVLFQIEPLVFPLHSETAAYFLLSSRLHKGPRGLVLVTSSLIVSPIPIRLPWVFVFAAHNPAVWKLKDRFNASRASSLGRGLYPEFRTKGVLWVVPSEELVFASSTQSHDCSLLMHGIIHHGKYIFMSCFGPPDSFLT